MEKHKEILDRLYHRPLVKPTRHEMVISDIVNNLLDSLRDMSEDEVMDTLDVLKHTCINIALKLNRKL